MIRQRLTLDFTLRITKLDSPNHAAHFIEFGKIAERFALKAVGQPLDVIGAAQWIDRMGHARFMGDDLLRSQGELHRLFGRQGQGLIEGIRVQRLRSAENPG